MIATRRRRDPALELAEQMDALAAAARRQYGLRWGLQAVAAGLLVDGALLLAGRFASLAIPQLWLAGPPLLLLFATALVVLLRRPDELSLATHTDRELGLQERLTTAVELRRHQADHPLAKLQIADTVDRLRSLPPARAFPLRIGRRQLAILTVSLLALLLPLALPSAESPTSVESARVQEVVAQEAERITALAADIENARVRERVDEATRAEIAKALQDASQSLQESNSPERAVAALSEAQRDLAAMRPAGAQDLGQALARAAQGLQNDSATRDAASKLAQGDAQSAAESLSSLGDRAADMSAAQRASAAQALRAAAANAGRFDSKLGDSLSKAAEALASGSPQAEAALDRAAAQLQETAQQSARQDLIEKAMSQVERSQATVARAAQAPGAEQPRPDRGQGVTAPNRGAKPNDAGNQEAGQQPDDAAAQSGAAGQEGAGSEGGQQGAQGEQGALGQQGAQGQGQQGQQGEPTAGRGTLAESTEGFDPSTLKSRIEQIASGDFEDPSVSTSDRTGLPNSGQATADYRDVYAVYQDRATAAMQDHYVPLDMQDLVRDYFSALDPSR